MKLIRFESDDPNWHDTECRNCFRLLNTFVVNDAETEYYCPFCNFQVNICICDLCGKSVDKLCEWKQKIMICKSCCDKKNSEGDKSLIMT